MDDIHIDGKQQVVDVARNLFRWIDNCSRCAGYRMSSIRFPTEQTGLVSRYRDLLGHASGPELIPECCHARMRWRQ